MIVEAEYDEAEYVGTRGLVRFSKTCNVGENRRRICVFLHELACHARIDT